MAIYYSTVICIAVAATFIYVAIARAEAIMLVKLSIVLFSNSPIMLTDFPYYSQKNSVILALPLAIAT